MAQLDIYLFGSPEFYRDGVRLNELAGHRAGSLLCFLLLNRQYPQSRETLAETLWPGLDPEVTRKYLRTTLWRLRSVLEPAGVPPGTHLQVAGNAISFNTEGNYWLDVEVFESLVVRLTGESEDDRADRLRRAVDLYRGDLLESTYEDWVVYERDRLQKLHIAALRELITYYADRHEYDEAIRHAEAILKHDRTHEQVHCEIMRLHFRAGRRRAALQQFQLCRDLLRQDLGVQPMRETINLYRQLLADVSPDEIEPDLAEPADTVSIGELGRRLGALDRLKAELDRLDEASARVRRAIEQLEHSRRYPRLGHGERAAKPVVPDGVDDDARRAAS